MSTTSTHMGRASGDAARETDTLVTLLRARAQQRPERVAYTFLADGEADEVRLTYAGLDARARLIAARLQSLDLGGERVLLLYPQGLEYIAAFFGCLYAGAVAVPAYPPRLNRSLERLRAVAADADATAALTTSGVLSRVRPALGEVPGLAALRWLATDELSEVAADEWREPQLHGDTLAFLQYTSGSTSAPKGVMVTHTNLLHNEELIRVAFDQSEESVIVGWLPMYHDMGLIGNVLQPLYLDARCVLMSPPAFLQRPARWLEAISRHRATTSGGPNFAYELCVSRVTEEQRAGLDLSSWSVAFNGAEPVRAETLERFAAAFAPCGFRREAFQPCYGLAEATLIVSGGRRGPLPSAESFSARALEFGRVSKAEDGEATRALVGCGRALPDEELLIVNPETLAPCASGEVGEIWVAGPSVARGYWGRPDETERIFGSRLAGRGPFLRTGDLGFLEQSELYVAGRLKDLIVIRGRNLYPQDIELTAEQSHAALRPGCCAAFSYEEGGAERLAVVAELDARRVGEAYDALAAIREAVAGEHEVPVDAVVLLRPGGVPKTSSGKLQRHACRAAMLGNGFEAVAEWRRTAAADAAPSQAAVVFESAAEVEEWAATQLAAHLGVDVSEIDIEQPIGRHGLDSLSAVELSHTVEAQLGVVLPATGPLQKTSVAELARLAMERRGLEREGAPLMPLAATPTQNELQAESPLSYGQRALWFLHQLAPESPAYNLHFAARIRSRLDVEALGRAFRALAERHDSLRATFHATDAGPVQRVRESADEGWRVVDASAWDEELLRLRLLEESLRPFDLEHGPVARACLFARGEGEHVLSLSVHHIAADFWSLALMLDELGKLYREEAGGARAALPLLVSRYAEYTRRQEELLSGEEGERLLDFWRETLAGDLPVLDLPTDRPRPPVQTYRGSAHHFRLGARLTDALKRLSRDSGTTLYATLLAAFYALLHRYTGQEDILVGSPAAGRGAARWRGLLGYFVNPVVLRARPSGTASFGELLAQVSETVLEASARQDYPFPLLVERLQPERDASRSPLFQALFVLYKSHLPGQQGLASFALGEGGGRIELGGLMLESLPVSQRVAQFDLTLAVAETDGELAGTFQYNSDLFDAPTIERMAGHFETLLRGAAERPGERLSSLPLLTEGERHQLVRGWNDTAAGYPREATITRLFERQAAATPDAVALVSGDERITYAELNAKANRLARRLRREGVGPEATVGVCARRTPELVAALLAVMKAGGAYVPLDPRYPRARVEFMLEDARAAVLLTEEGLAEDVPAHGATVIRLDTDCGSEGESAEDLPVGASADNLAYVIYTSGTTGRPKGVAIEHRSAVALIEWSRGVFTPRELSGVLASTSVCFDLSVFELFVTLCCGGKVILAEDALRLPGLPAAGEVTLINTVPSAMTELLRDGRVPSSVCAVNLAGEPLLSHLVKQVYEVETVERLFNLYGPSEDTTYSTFALMSRAGGESSLIGRPISNSQVYLLDSQLNPVPVGVPGEVYIGGDGLARGYLNRPDLTAEKFVPDPFSGVPGARLYRTQDLARYLPGGDLIFLGRIDHQVKVRGFRIELGEVETALGEHPRVRETVVLAREDEPGDRRLVAYVVAEREQALTAAELRAFLHERLPDFMIPSAFVLMEALPLTPNGKVDRRALPVPDIARAAEDPAATPRNAVEEVVAEVWSEVLGVGRVGAHENFFDLGGHSLLATQVVSRLRHIFHIELPLSTVFEKPRLAELSEAVESVIGNPSSEALPPVVRVERRGPLPLSFAQRRLWFLDQLEPNSPAYNMPAAVRINGRLDAEALGRALFEVVRRHEALRTTFAEQGGEPLQLIGERIEMALTLTDVSGARAEEEALRLVHEEVRRPFDLSKEPPLRAQLLRLADEEYVLTLVMHHIASDGWSVGVLVRELASLYETFTKGEESRLTELPVQYADYAAWQREHVSGEFIERQLSYWRGRLAGVPPLELPADRPRPATPTHRGAQHSLTLPPDLLVELKALARREGATLFMVLMAAFQALLSRYSTQEDFAVGTPVANRRRSELEGLIGFFVNTLVIRADISADPTFVELLARVRSACLGAYAHQDVPFEKLVEELQPERDLGRSPLFQAMLAWQESPLEWLRLPGLSVSGIDVESGVAKFDLLLLVGEEAGGLCVTAEYSADLFDDSTIARMLTNFERLLRAAATDAAEPVSRLELLDDAERRRLLVEWNDTARPFDSSLCIHQLFERQAALTPDTAAVVSDVEHLTYAELNASANRIAHRLLRLGLEPESRVGVCLSRSPEMLAALLGVLKAGGAYVPLDPQYPRERLRLMLEDSGARVLLTQTALAEAVPFEGLERLLLDEERESLAVEPAHDPAARASAGNLAYVIYTSGSTGRPKGVAIEHRSVAAFSQWARETFDAEDFSGVLASTSVCFDLSIFELFVPLQWGGTVVIAENALQAAAAAGAHKVTLINTVPSAMTELLRLGQVPESVRTVNLAGEPLQKRLVRKLYALPHVARVFNLYGPTEDTTYSTWGLMARDDQEPVTIGGPLHNTRVYLLDTAGRPVPTGVPGLLHLGGAGLARGYLGRPELTAERFVPDPFSTDAGARLYNTGDLARYLADGRIEFLGRVDHQVKIRGFRIELGEIETALFRHDAVKDCVVVAREDESGDKRLVAYLVCEGSGVEPSELRAFLKEWLAAHMIPSAFVVLPALPLTPNGKIDRRALPPPDSARREAGSDYVAPRGEVEESLSRVWAGLLGVERVGVEDDFFELGGHSLLATRVASAVRERFGVEVPVRSLFESPTVAALARIVEEQQARRSNGGAAKIQSRPRARRPTTELKARLQRLSDEEVRRLLEEKKQVSGDGVNNG